MIVKEVEVRVSETGLDETTASAEKLNSSLKKVDSSEKNLKKSAKETGLAILENGGAMGLLNDLTGGFAMTVKDAVEAYDLFGKGTKLNTLYQTIYTAVVGTSTGALKAFKIALATTGVGVLIIALGFLISKMSDATDATEEQKKAQEALNYEIEKTIDIRSREIDGIEFSTELRIKNARIAGKSEKDLLDITLKASDEKIEALHAERDALLELQGTKDLTYEQSVDINKKLRANNDAVIKEINGQTLAQKDYEIKLADERRAREKEANDKRLEAIKKHNQERLEAERAYQKELLEGIRNLNLILYQVSQDQFSVEYQAELEKNALLKGIRTTTAEQRLEEDRLRDRQILDNASATQEEYLELEIYYMGKRQEMEDARIKAQQDRDAEVAKNKEEQFKGNLENLNTILSVGGAKFAKLQKVLASAEVVRDTIRAVNAATGNEIKVPAFIGTIPNPVKPASLASTALSIGAAVAKGAASLLAINSDSKSVSGGGAPASGGGGGGGAPAPSFNIVGQNANNQLAQTIASKQNQPVEAFVVGQAVTTQQAADRHRVNTATFNGG